MVAKTEKAEAEAPAKTEEKPAESTAVVAKQESQLPAGMEDADSLMEEFGNYGQAESQSELAVPFLAIAQKTSPQVNKRDGKYIEGCDPGCLFNSVTLEMKNPEKDEYFTVIPITHITRFVEWVPRESGGGYVGQTNEKPRGLKKNDKGQDVNDAGNIINETVYHLCLDAENGMLIIIACASTNLGASRQWMTKRMAARINGKLPPAFFRKWKVNVSYKQNEKGDWFVYNFEDAGWNDNSVFRHEAAQMARSVKENGFEVGRPPEPDEASAPAQERGGFRPEDKDIPF